MFISLKRILISTGRQIGRSGWLSWASVLVMALAFFIGSVFIFLAYVSNLFLLSIENEAHIYVFFNTGTKTENILQLQDEWLKLEEVEKIEFTNEEQAVDEFKNSQERNNPQVSESIRSNTLPPSLGIRLFSIQDAQKIIDIVEAEKSSNEDIYEVAFSEETINTIRSLFYWLRFGGTIIMTLLLIVIFTFTLLTVEFRTFMRSEEIGIMQLVGGKLWYIRAPFVLEGGFYGFIGSLVSTTILYSLFYLIFFVNKDSSAVTFLINFFGNLKWPTLELIHYVIIFIVLLIFGFIVGSLNSFVAIRRYIN
jgi:cell division transport system permease protein